MIVRVFRGEVRPGMEAAYERMLLQRGIPEFRAQPGMLAVHVGTPLPHSPHEFLVITVWRDLESLQAFAGDRWTEAMVSPDEAGTLARTDVHHFESSDPDLIEMLGAPGPWSDQLDLGRVRLDLLKRTATIDGRQVELPPREFAVLAELAARPNQPIPSEDLARRVWPDGNGTTGDDVRRTVYRLRKLIGDNGGPDPLIRNRRGFGYLLTVAGR